MDSNLKMQKFITRLMANSCFADETPFKIEDQIKLFFNVNQSSLKPTFSSEAFFPQLSWEESRKLFYITLREMTNKAIRPTLNKLISTQMDFSFLNVINRRKRLPEEYSTQFLEFLIELIKQEPVRKKMDTVLTLINFRLVDKYIEEICLKRSYTVFELEKVQKLRLNPKDTTSYIKLSLFIHLLAYTLDDVSKGGQGARSESNVLFLNEKQCITIFEQYKSKLSYLPEELVLNGVKANMSFMEDEMLPASSRISRVLFQLAKSYRPDIQIARGAETFEKSWFQIQKKNFRFFGFDEKMIDEFYRIAAENYW